MSRFSRVSTPLLVLLLICSVSVRPAAADQTSSPNAGSVAAGEKTLYERLGGVQAISAVVDDFVNRLVVNEVVMSNPQVKKAAESGHFTLPGLKFLLTEQLCAASGGPQKYTGRSMKESHKGLMITEREWDAGAADLIATLEKFKVPAKEQKEILAFVVSTKKDIVTQGSDVAAKQ